MHSDTPRSGTFACSDELVNQLWRNIDWGQRGNFLSVPTDCPQRDERLGWLADAQVFLPDGLAEHRRGRVRHQVGRRHPRRAVCRRRVLRTSRRGSCVERDGAPAWADAGIIVPWVIWRRYGDTRLLERHWDAMERYLAYLERHNPDLLWTARRGNDYGDWLSVGAHTPRDVLATAYWAHDAAADGRDRRRARTPERVEHYERLRAGIAAAFNAAYVGDDAYIEGDTQTVVPAGAAHGPAAGGAAGARR